MSAQIRHFVLTPDGSILEFSGVEAAQIASGSNLLPQFASSRLRYLQVSVDDESSDEGIQVQTAGAAICFDASGRLAEAVPPGDDDQLTRFEIDTCVQLALKDVGLPAPALN